LVGSHRADVTVPFVNFTYFESGKAELFYRHQGGEDNWGKVYIVSSRNIQNYSEFGSSVALGETHAYIGATREDAVSANDTISTAGNVYIYYLKDTVTAVNDKGLAPKEYELSQNYPNPFNPSTTISFNIPVESNVNITVYNILGQKAAEIVDKNLKAGKHNVEWNAEEYSSGMYIYRMNAEAVRENRSRTMTKKMLLVK
jgi:hypothetical protein